MNRIDISKPIMLEPATVWRTYIGGKMLAQMHNETAQDTNFPEEWLMSIVSARNSGREGICEGMSMISGSQVSLKDLIHSNPERILGNSHYFSYGETTGVLVKLIDAGERLTVQCHPTKEAARRLFNSEFGKTECWHILDGRIIKNEIPSIYYGFKESITKEYWKSCFEKQDIDAMLNCLHRFPVQTGDTYLIRGGVPHAIGAGCFLIEIQEPTDYTIRTERITPAGLKISDFMMHQGLGFEKMFECFEYCGTDENNTKLSGCISPIDLESTKDYTFRKIIGYDNTSCFQMCKAIIRTKYEVKDIQQFFGMYVINGNGTIVCNDNNSISINKGTQLFIPACAENFEIRNKIGELLEIIFAYGPQPKKESVNHVK